MTDGIEICLDWDLIALAEALERIERIKLNNTIKQITLYESASQKGYHCICETYYYMNPTLVYILRRAWKDDGDKLVEDVMYKSAPFREVLFSYKVIKGLKISRTKMFILYRLKYYSSTWQSVSLEPEEKLEQSQKEKKSLITSENSQEQLYSKNFSV